MSSGVEKDVLPKPPWIKVIMGIALVAAVVAFRRAHVRKVH